MRSRKKKKIKFARLSVTEVELIAATRFLFGFGCGLLLASRISRRHRRCAGTSLLILGAVSTPWLIRDLHRKIIR